jgi:hypothetical protein
MNSISTPSGIGIGTVVTISIVVGLIVFFANKYSADQKYVSVGSYDSSTFQPKGDYVTVSQFDPAIKALKDSTDMMSQQMKNTMSVTANLLRSVGFIRISPNTVLLSTSTSGLATGFGGLPSCIGEGSPLMILSGSPSFVDKVMAYKDVNPTSTFQEAILAAVKSIGTESFRFRRRQDTAVKDDVATIFQDVKNPYMLQLQNNLVNNLMSVDIGSISTDDKKLLSSFVSKYLFIIKEFDQKTGFPIIQSIPDIFAAGKQTTSLTPSSNTYQTILNDIYRYNPHLLNSC